MMTQPRTDFNPQSFAAKAQRLFDDIQAAARQGQAAHHVEKSIFEGVLGLGRELLELFFAMQGPGDLGETFELPDGRTVRRLPGHRRRTYESVFGSFELERAVYGSRDGQKIQFVPLDQRLALPESCFSYLLQDWAVALSTEHAFARVSQTLAMILGLGQAVDSLERMNRQMAESVAGFRDTCAMPPADEEGAILVATADNKGVPMCRSAGEPRAAGRRTKGQKKNKKKMAAVGTVYSVDRHLRTPEDVTAALFGDLRPDRDERRPPARHKRACASLTLDDQPGTGQDAVFEWMAQQVEQRRADRPLVLLADGQRSLWADGQRHLAGDDVVEILDLMHVTTRLWDAAHLFYREGSGGACDFVRDRCLGILRGRVGYVIGGLRQMATKRKLSSHKTKKLERLCQYLENNRQRMRYDQYLRAGYPIASGVIEGACRHIIKDRMERAGMRWTVQGAQAMLDLRTTHINGQWADFNGHRIEQENSRLYPHTTAPHTAEWPIAA